MTERPTALADDGLAMATEEITRLHIELQKRGASIRGFEVALAAERKALGEARADIEALVRHLAELEDERDALRRELEYGRACKPTGFAGWLYARQSRPAPPAPAPAKFHDVPGADFIYFLNTSPFRLFRDPGFMIRGWAFPRSGEPITAFRARVDDTEFFGTYGIEEPSVIAHFGPQPNNPKPGFKVLIETPPGRHHLSFEAKVADGDWVSFLKTPIWARHSRS